MSEHIFIVEHGPNRCCVITSDCSRRHGVKQPRYPWSDGPEYITQCPIRPGASFSQKVIFSTEVGTLWWHAHSDWTRTTVYGAIIIYPRKGSSYPFRKPDAEVPILLGEWWKRPIMDVYHEMLRTGGDPNVSDAFLINGQPGDLYPCSKQGQPPLLIHYVFKESLKYNYMHI